MNTYLKLGITFFLSILFFSCSQADEELIIGKWQNDQDWFVYKKDKTYDAGKSIVGMVHNYKYSIDSKSKELSMYTDEDNQTYYLIYKFIGKDTMAVRNRLSSNTQMIKFHRVK